MTHLVTKFLVATGIFILVLWFGLAAQWHDRETLPERAQAVFGQNSMKATP